MKQDCPQSGVLSVLEKHYKKCSTKFVHVCMSIGREDVLFDNIYNLISCDALFEGFFLECLEEHIPKLGNSIPAAILKNFIDYYSKNTQLIPRLEKCILNFDIASLDLHNLISLCKQYRLLDAFIHLYNNALSDYQSPLEEIILMMEQPLLFLTYETAAANLRQKNELALKEMISYGNKLLVYMHCCLCGQSYPYGMVIADDVQNDRVRRTTFDYIISKRNRLIDKLLEEEKKQANAASPLAKYLNNNLIDTENNFGNYPILRMFLNFSSLDFLNVISMSFAETSFEAVIGLEKKQQLIDILIEIGLNSSSFLLSNQFAGNLFTFLARQIANEKNNCQVDDLIFAQIIEYLCNTEDTDRLEEREQTLLALLSSNPAHVFERFNIDRLLSLAVKAKFFRACEILYELRGEHHELIDCYLNQENSLDRQLKVFEVARNILQQILYNEKKRPSFNSENPNSRDSQFKHLQEKLIRYETLKQMINMNPCETIYLLWIEMGIDLKFLIRTIKTFGNNKLSMTQQITKTSRNLGTESSLMYNFNDGDEECSIELRGKGDCSLELLFKFIKGLFDLAELIKPDKKYIHCMSQFSVEYCELYVDLICMFEPDKILHVLRTSLSDYSYRVEECLRICRERKNWEGAAYLLEKSGQIEAAYDIKAEKLNTLIQQLLVKLADCDENELDAIKSNIDANLVMIVQLCQRNSRTLSDSTKEKLWFTLFEKVMGPIGALNTMEANKKRLDEVQYFFKQLGAYIINSMMGYINLTSIIDRIVCDPMYGASNFGDIKDLMGKMLEVCSYEEILLNTTSNLVSNDVHKKLVDYKKLSSKSFSTFSLFCNYCTKHFDPDKSQMSSNNSLNLSNESPILLASDSSRASHFENFLVESKNDSNDSKFSVCIYHCGHSFHESCLEINQIRLDAPCPLCNSTLTQKRVMASQAPKNANKIRSFVDGHVDLSEINKPNKSSALSLKQIDALKSIRSRNFDSSPLLHSKRVTSIQTQSKLKLAPANLSKFIQ